MMVKATRLKGGEVVSKNIGQLIIDFDARNTTLQKDEELWLKTEVAKLFEERSIEILNISIKER